MPDVHKRVAPTVCHHPRCGVPGKKWSAVFVVCVYDFIGQIRGLYVMMYQVGTVVVQGSCNPDLYFHI